MTLHVALDEMMGLVKATNRYLETKAPWLAWKTGDRDGVGRTLYYAAEALRLAGLLLSPIMPAKMAEFAAQLGVPPAHPTCRGGTLGLPEREIRLAQVPRRRVSPLPPLGDAGRRLIGVVVGVYQYARRPWRLALGPPTLTATAARNRRDRRRRTA